MKTDPPGWYADPVTVGSARYWDGRGWTDLVSWGGDTWHSETPLIEVERCSAAQDAHLITSYLENAARRHLISTKLARLLRQDIETMPLPGLARAVQDAPPRPTSAPIAPDISPQPQPTSAPIAPDISPQPQPTSAPIAPDISPQPQPTSAPIAPDISPQPQPISAAVDTGTTSQPPPPTGPPIGTTSQPPPPTGPPIGTTSQPRPSTRPPIKPIPVEPGALARWWKQAQDSLRSDLALHGLAYLGVLLMFAGVLGLVVFSFGEVRPELRTLTEFFVPLTLLVAGWYLHRRGAVVVSGALIVLGAAVVPLVTAASVTDGAPIPPDVHGAALPIVQSALFLVIALVMYLVVRRDESSPVRFVWAPVIWVGAGLFAAVFRDPVPAGYEVARADALQLAVVLAAAIVTMLATERWAGRSPMSAATVAVGLPVAGAVYVLELILAGNEGWPVPATLLAGAAVLLLVEHLDDRFPDWVITAAHATVIAITGARLAVHTSPEWTAAITGLALLALLEYAGWRRPTTTGAWITLGAAGVAIWMAAPSAPAGALAFAMAAIWALWRHVAPPAWLGVRDTSGIAAAVMATAAVVEVWRLVDVGPALLLTGLLVFLVALAGRTWPSVGADVLWIWVTPSAAAAVFIASIAVPWGDAPTAVAVSTALAGVALLASVVATAPKTWTISAMTVWSLANLALALEIDRNVQAVVLAGLALALVVLGLQLRWGSSHHVALIGHVTGLGALFIPTGLGWPAAIAVSAATGGWVATTVVHERRGAVHLEWLRSQEQNENPSTTSLLDNFPAVVALGGLAASALLATDAGGVVAAGDAWAGTVIGAVAVFAAGIVRLAPWRRADPIVLTWATLALSIGSIIAVSDIAPEASTWPIIVGLGLGIAVVLGAAAPRPALFGWVGWAESAGLTVLVAERAGLDQRWLGAALAGWGAVGLVGALVRDRMINGPAPTQTFVREKNLGAPATLGALAMVIGSVWTLTEGTTTEIGWTAAGLAAVALATAWLLSFGPLAALAATLATTSYTLLAPWQPIEHPWSLLPVAAALALAAWALRSPDTEPPTARWDIPLFAVAHGVTITALIAAPEYNSIAITYLAAAALALATALTLKRWEWAAAAAILTIIAATDTEPEWLAHTVTITWGAVGLVGALVRDRMINGPAPTQTFVREKNLGAPATLGALAMVIGSVWTLTEGTTTEIGWTAAGLAAVALATAWLLSFGPLAALAATLATTSYTLLAPWQPIEHPWSLLPVAAALALAAWALRSPDTEPPTARWDIPLFAVAHGVTITALIAAPEYNSIAITYLAAAALALATALTLKRWEWAAAAAILTIIAATDAGEGWLALALLLEGCALTVAGQQRETPTRWMLLGTGSAAIVSAWFTLTDWQTMSVSTVMYATTLGAASISAVAAAWLRLRDEVRDLAIVWTLTGAITATIGATFVTDPDIARRPGGLTVAAAMVLLAFVAGISAAAVHAALRSAATGLLAAAWIPTLWAIEPTDTTIAVVATLIAATVLGAALAANALSPASPWIGPAAVFAVVTQMPGVAAAASALPSSNLMIAVLLAAAAELIALGVITSESRLMVAAPVSACAAWILYARDAFSGEANWFTVPIGLTVLVMVGTVRWIRRNRGGDVTGHDVVITELIAMAFLVASPLAQSLAGQLWNALLAIAIGVLLAGWGLLTQVLRRAVFGVGAVVVAVLLLIGVPLAEYGSWRGPTLWITVIVIGLTAVVIATSIERGRDRLEQIRDRFVDMIDGWERIGSTDAGHTIDLTDSSNSDADASTNIEAPL